MMHVDTAKYTDFLHVNYGFSEMWSHPERCCTQRSWHTVGEALAGVLVPYAGKFHNS